MPNTELPIDLDNQVVLMKKYVNLRQRKKMRDFLGYAGYFRASRYGKYLLTQVNVFGSSYKADYLLVGKSSGGYEFVLIELENPYGQITLQDGNLGAEFRDGISQLDEWKRWLRRKPLSLSIFLDLAIYAPPCIVYSACLGLEMH